MKAIIKTLSNLISAHRRSVKAKNQYDLKAKLLRYGLSKGFESSLLYDLLNDRMRINNRLCYPDPYPGVWTQADIRHMKPLSLEG